MNNIVCRQVFQDTQDLYTFFLFGRYFGSNQFGAIMNVIIINTQTFCVDTLIQLGKCLRILMFYEITAYI